MSDETKQSARELLRDARVALYDEMHGVHNGSFMDGLERRNRKDTLIATIDAYLAAPSESEMEVVDELEKLLNMDQAVFPPKDSYEKAAALIEGLQRMVPRAMLLELLREYWPMGDKPMYDKAMVEIAAKYGVVIE